MRHRRWAVAKPVQPADRVWLSERVLEDVDFHGAILQCLGEPRPRTEAHHRAGLRPGDLEFAQMTWKRSPGLEMCGRLTDASAIPGAALRRAKRSGGLKGRFIDRTAAGGWGRL